MRFGRSCIFLFSAMLMVATVSCSRVSPAEERIIGIWEFIGLDATGRVVFRRDHTVVDLFPRDDVLSDRWGPTSWGKWRLEGNDIIVTDQQMLVGADSSPEPRTTRIPIQDLQEGRLVRADGRSDFKRVRSVAAEYLQLRALCYLVVSCVALAAIFYLARKSTLRRGLGIIAAASAIAIVSFALTLIAELTQTGTLILSWDALHQVRIIAGVLEFTYLSTLIFGLARLIYYLRKMAPAGSN